MLELIVIIFGRIFNIKHFLAKIVFKVIPTFHRNLKNHCSASVNKEINDKLDQMYHPNILMSVHDEM